ncbi:MAG: hydantoinase/oxoprolinase family protein [Anaerolineae bacterium]
MLFIGVDIGGTFTDLFISENGTLRIHKLLSTPHDPADAMLRGLMQVTNGDLAAVQRLVHGSTVATNAILERKGAKTALITTAGFRDLLLIGRQHRPALYALSPVLPPPLIPRERCYEVPQRMDATGERLQPLDMKAVDAVLDVCVRDGIESIAVCFLFSHLNAGDEMAVRDRAFERGLYTREQIVTSSGVLPEFREYERASTTALEAYVRPVMDRYLGHLESAIPTPVWMMKSDGGIATARYARARSIVTSLSGPAAGVIGAFHLAKQAGCTDIITLDIGGTSTDVSLCPAAPIYRSDSEIDGFPLRTRVIDIETVGAGGGSIARLDSGGGLQVGPESAGALPGPIAYGRGGTQITVSDANVALGRIDPHHFLGGTMPLDGQAAEAAIRELGESLGLSLERAALGVITLANANIDRAVRRVSIARGYDPRAFTLVAFGGAGGLHACEVAERLEIPRVLIPRLPGVLCALGLLLADVTLDYSDHLRLDWLRTLGYEAVRAHIDRRFEHFTDLANDALEKQGIAPENREMNRFLDMRYEGQAYELTIPLSDTPFDDFHAAHERAYGHALRSRPVEIVNLRLSAVGRVEKPEFIPEPVQANDGSAALIGSRRVPLPTDGGIAEGDLRLYERERLTPGARITGAALIVQLDSTTYLPPRWSAEVDAYRNLILVSC